MATVKIEGMSCSHCVLAVTRALNSVKGVKGVRVDLARGEAAYEETAPVSLAAVKEAIRKAGYEVV